MNHKIYAMEMAYMNQLLAERKELLRAIEGLSAIEMRTARAELIEQCSHINITPSSKEDLDNSYTVDDLGVAHISIVGQLTPKAHTDACGAYTADALTEYGHIVAASRAAGADERVNSVEFYVDTPGGYVDGLMPAVKAMREISKPTKAVVGGMAASAGYWLASQTDEIIATSEISRFGSIGVAVEEFDNTKMLENAGITKRVYTSTDAPLKRPNTSTEEGQMEVIQRLDDLHAVFAGNVAEGRGVDVQKVNDTFGRGAVFTAQEALRRGMIDNIETMPARRADSLTIVDGSNTAATAEEKKQEVKMITLDDLKKENSTVYTEAVQAGVKEERKRRNDISDIMKADSENANLKTVCEEAIENGTVATEVAFQTKVQVAIRDGAKLSGENAPSFASDHNDPATGLTAEERSLCENLGISADEFLVEKKRGE